MITWIISVDENYEYKSLESMEEVDEDHIIPVRGISHGNSMSSI
jgi:hypothetical protein